MARVGVAAAFVAAATAVTTRGLAAPAPAPSSKAPDAEHQRRDMYRLAVAAAEHGDWATAKERFARVVALRPSAKALFSLAQAEEHVGEVASAQAAYEEARTSAQMTREADVVAAAASAEEALEPRVPHLHVVVTGSDAAAASAALDDHPIPTNLLVAVNPGAHRIVVRSPTSKPAALSIDVHERQQLELPVLLEPFAATGGEATAATVARPPGVDADASSAGSGSAKPWRIASYAAFGAAGVALGLGVYFGVDAHMKNDDSYSQGCRGDLCSPGAAQTRDTALTEAHASTALFLTGGALVAAGIGGLIVAAQVSSRERVISLAVTGNGALLRGTF